MIGMATVGNGSWQCAPQGHWVLFFQWCQNVKLFEWWNWNLTTMPFCVLWNSRILQFLPLRHLKHSAVLGVHCCQLLQQLQQKLEQCHYVSHPWVAEIVCYISAVSPSPRNVRIYHIMVSVKKKRFFVKIRLIWFKLCIWSFAFWDWSSPDQSSSVIKIGNLNPLFKQAYPDYSNVVLFSGRAFLLWWFTTA